MSTVSTASENHAAFPNRNSHSTPSSTTTSFSFSGIGGSDIAAV